MSSLALAQVCGVTKEGESEQLVDWREIAMTPSSAGPWLDKGLHGEEPSKGLCAEYT